MKKTIRKKLPQWYLSEEDYGLILTDDIDSLLGCAIIQTIRPNWKIEQIMLFKANKGKDTLLKDFLGITDSATHEPIGVDLALCNGKCFDNHLSKVSEYDSINKEAINLNIVNDINRHTYFKKYNASTVLLLWSLYQMPKCGLDEELMMILLTIDGTYTGQFNEGGKYAKLTEWYLSDLLGLSELYECLKRHKKHEFEEIKKKYNLADKITLKKGYATTTIRIDEINEVLSRNTDIIVSLPNEQFKLHKTFVDIAKPLGAFVPKKEKIVDNPYCLALTKKNYVNYSVEI